MPAFQGGIFGGSNPFRSGGGRTGGGGGRPSQPQPNPYEDYDNSPPMMGGMRSPGPTYGGGMGSPMTGGQTHSYSTYQDSDGNRHEEGYGPGGPFSNSARGGMGMSQGPPPQGRPHPGSLLGGRNTGPGAFSSSFWSGPNPFRSNGANGPPNGRSGPNTGPRDPSFRMEVEPAPMPPSNGLTSETSELIADFLAEQTQPLGGPITPPNAECPICLEPPSASHLCVQIKNIPGCNHLIGRECLKEMLVNRPDDAKKCPICRAEFLAEDGIWQDSEQFQQLGRGGPAGYGGGPPPGYGGGMSPRPAGYGGGGPPHAPQMPPQAPRPMPQPTPRPTPRPAPPSYASAAASPAPRGPPSYMATPRPPPTPRAAPGPSPHAAPPGLRNAMRGGARVHGMGDVGRGRGNEQDDDGGMQGGPPMMNQDRWPPEPREPETNFGGRGQQLGYMDERQLW
ncbi:uncharacterized protein J4E88_009275 [Alternaria novae-zelandiae]|uniref:uncharacterized protein n=1 Tax=Alternaria novae-zelandiae TaxID=430562 RepID=UPI0020C55345|nr:uncharacterized protein J4E88_009275 [Alternaria novae-zelandiae]KAI4671242.1 hypothetical protein J4E88_009275 [Alternaria novae-zelandiae]